MLSRFRRGLSFLRNLLLNPIRILSSPNRSGVAAVTILILLIATAASAFALKGYFAPTNEFQAFEVPASQLSTIYSFVPNESASLPTTNFSVLYNSSQNATVVNDTLLGSFSSPNVTAVTFQENTYVNADRYPYFAVSVTTAPSFTSTSGFGFGLRFQAGLADGSVVLLMNDSLPVEHVRSGGTIVLSVDVLNYRAMIVNITGIRIYAEERAGINSNYSIQVNSITSYSLKQVSSCLSPVCYVPLNLPNNTGYFDTLVADTVFTGTSNYNLALSYDNQIVVSRPYSNGTSHVSIQGSSQFRLLSSQGILLASTPLIPNAVYVISTSVPTSLQLNDLKLTFTPAPTLAIGSPVSSQTSIVLLFSELILVFGLPAELLLFRHRLSWRVTLLAGISIRLMIMPWTGHPFDTLLWIRTAYLYYHQGWTPIFYNPPTIFAIAVPTGFMQFYYLLGLNYVDTNFLFHYGGVLATLFVKMPFLLADVASATILAKVSQNRMYSMFYFLNPFSIYVSAVWGEYEGLATLALIAGYVAIAKLRPGLDTIAGFGSLLLGGLIELFGFLVVPFLAVYFAIRKRYLESALPVLGTIIVLLIPSSLNQFFLLNFVNTSSPTLQPDVYSFSGNFGINSQLPFFVGVAASAIVGFYSLIRTSAFFSTIAPVSAVIISFELFALNHPQLMLIPLGLMILLFAARNDAEGVVFVWICGAILAFISMVGTQSFAYLLTGEGYYLIPLIEGGQHLKFYAVGLLIVSAGLLARAYKNVPLWLNSLFIVAFVSFGWFMVNFV